MTANGINRSAILHHQTWPIFFLTLCEHTLAKIRNYLGTSDFRWFIQLMSYLQIRLWVFTKCFPSPFWVLTRAYIIQIGKSLDDQDSSLWSSDWKSWYQTTRLPRLVDHCKLHMRRDMSLNLLFNQVPREQSHVPTAICLKLKNSSL